MFDWLNDFSTWMSALPPLWAYVTILVIAYGENVLPPIPGDMVVVFGGYLVGLGQLDFGLVVLLSTVGGALGFMTMYALGRRLGHVVHDPSRLRWLPKEQVEKVDQWLGRWGYGVVAANRFLSGARSVIALAVGVAEMDMRTTFICATFSALLWTALIVYAGYAVGDNWTVIGEYLRKYGRFVISLLIVVALVQAGRWWYRQRRRGGA